VSGWAVRSLGGIPRWLCLVREFEGRELAPPADSGWNREGCSSVVGFIWVVDLMIVTAGKRGVMVSVGEDEFVTKKQ